MQYQFTPKQAIRFWSRVQKSEVPDACWEWIDKLDKDGYGKIGIRPIFGQAFQRAHRVAWAMTCGVSH